MPHPTPLLFCLVVFALPVFDTLAQPYPSKPVRIIVSTTPGGTNDIVGRIVGKKLTEAWGQSVIVENRGGAGNVVGTTLGAKANSDGYTLLIVNVGLAVNPALVKNLPYDALNDFSPVSLLATSPSVLVVHPSFTARSVQELIALAKSKPGQLNYASTGAGSTGHIAMELFKSMAGINIVAVHYNGAGPALVDIIGGRISPGFATILAVIPHLEPGRLRALAVSTTKRSSILPKIPTVAEAGLPGYEFTGWWGIVVPANTPRSIISKLNAELGRILAQPDVKRILISQGADPAHTSPEQFTAYIKSETVKWSKVAREANIQVNY